MNGSSQRGGVIFTLFLLLIVFGIVGAGVVAFMRISHTDPFNPSFLEHAPPEISWQAVPLGLGADAIALNLTVKDSGAGLDEVIVRISQNNQPKELLRKQYTEGAVRNEILQLSLNGKELGLREGNAELQVLAFDRTFWSNGAKLSKSLPVNFTKPHISVVTPQQNAVLGGSELVFYKVLGKTPSVQGVLSKGGLYPGFPAKYWDDTLKSYENLYLALFPVPASFKEARDAMQLIARDDIGNSTSVPFNYRIRQRRWSSFRVVLNELSAGKLTERLMAYAHGAKITLKTSGDRISDLSMLLRALARNDDVLLSEPLSHTEGLKFWSGAFLKPVESTPSNSEGDTRAIMLGDQEILKTTAAGARFSVSKRTSVVAANGGRVSFVGDLGLLGKTIVIDHGFGLATVYAHLSDIEVLSGATVSKGQAVAKTGSSGFALSEEVYFEVRLHGVPVSPNEWWDESWVTDHIENKLAFVRTEVVGGSSE